MLVELLRLGCVAMVIGLFARTANADDRHTFYAELFGKGGLWGFGYDLRLGKRFAVGAVASYYVLGGDRYTTLAPYVAAYPVGERHRWFVQAGPQFVRRVTPSPVPEWDGMSKTGVAGELSSGYEYRDHIVLRVYGMAAIGERFVPWVGASIGWTL
jgi:hypothetical protein